MTAPLDVLDRAQQEPGPVSAEPNSRQPKSKARALTEHLAPLGGFAVFLGIWYFMAYKGMSPGRRFLVPPPHRVINRSFIENPTIRRELLSALWRTTQVAAVGLILSIIIGVSVATVMSRAKWLERMIWPYAIALQAVPALAIAPLIGAFFSFNFKSRVIVCVIISVFPIIANTLFGLISADASQHDLFTLHGASRWTRLMKLQFPAALPQIFTGLRISAGLSVIGAVVGDLIFREGEAGIGRKIDVFRARLQNPEMYGAIILSSLLGIVVFFLFTYLGRLAVGRWHESTGQT